MGALSKSELVAPNSRVHTEFPFFAKTPWISRKSSHSEHRSNSAEKVQTAAISRQQAGVQGIAGLAMDCTIPCRPAETWLVLEKASSSASYLSSFEELSFALSTFLTLHWKPADYRLSAVSLKLPSWNMSTHPQRNFITSQQTMLRSPIYGR